jgi:hypothetical protein
MPRVLAIVLAVGLAAAVPAAPQGQAPGSSAAEQAREDLRFLVREITTRHPNPFYLTPKAVFDREVAELSSRLPSLERHAVAIGFARIAALVGDGHTRTTVPFTGGVLPLEAEWLDGAWRVVRVSPDHRGLLGAKLTALDSTEIDTVYQRVGSLVAAHESEGFSRHLASRFMMAADVLDALKISAERGRVKMTGVTDAGESRSAMVVAGARPMPTEWIEPAPPPLARQPDMRQAVFAWRPIAASRTGYVSFNSYQTGQSRGDFGTLTRTVFQEMDAARIDRVIVDLRWNGGGDFTRGREFVLEEIRKRDRWLKPRAFYVLIGRRTFSAAMVNTVDFKRAAGAILVGEPTGARPNSYSETGFFQLPNSGIQATVSICRYEAWPEDVPGVPPDQLIPPTWADYRDGRDAALEWILSQPAPDPSAAPFKQTGKLTPPCRRR